MTLSAAVAGIALDGVDNAVFAFLHDADMIGLPVLRTGRAFVVPIEENDLTGRRLKAAVLPLSTVLEPLHPIDTACELRNNAAVDIAALIRTPRYSIQNASGIYIDSILATTEYNIVKGCEITYGVVSQNGYIQFLP